MQCEITTCYRCGADIHGDRWKLTMYSQTKQYSWKAINWNRYYCRDCAARVMAELEKDDTQ